MGRPCETWHPFSPDTCNVCRHYRDNPELRAHWDGQSPPSPTEARGLPGTELKALLEKLGVTKTHDCGCEDKARQMDFWGVEGCRQRRGEIVEWLHLAAGKFGWRDKAAVALRAVGTGLALRLGVTDPLGGLVDEAIRLAGEKGTSPRQVVRAARRPKAPTPPEPTANKQSLLLHNGQSPGDITVMTAAIEMLHQQHPGKYLTAVEVPSGCEQVFTHNPHVVPPSRLTNPRRVEMDGYDLIHRSGQRPVHFLEAYVKRLSEQLNVKLTLTTNRPHLYLSEEEREWGGRLEGLVGRKGFWLVNAGVKRDYTAKGWGAHNYQALVHELNRHSIRVVQVGSLEHVHKPLDSAVNLLGKTSPREFIVLAYHAAGGVGPCTWLQHVMAAWEKPYVCIAGGREGKSWIDYPTQTTLSTVGQLTCCRTGGCWKSRTVPLGDGDAKDKSLCERPVLDGPEPVPYCLNVFTPRRVAEEVLRYYAGGVVPA